ncbi:Nucleic-acid-binding protein from transposon X-element, partial [Harpegnathos saltator]
EQIKVQAKDPQIYRTITKELVARNTEFHTYKPKQDRSFRVVLKNMHSSTDMEELKQAINNHGHEVTNIWNVKQRVTKKPLPLFFVEIKPGSNNKEIYKIKTLLQCRIQFEAPRPKREIPQCTGCQRYGHTKSFCFRKPRCVKC